MYFCNSSHVQQWMLLSLLSITDVNISWFTSGSVRDKRYCGCANNLISQTKLYGKNRRICETMDEIDEWNKHEWLWNKGMKSTALINRSFIVSLFLNEPVFYLAWTRQLLLQLEHLHVFIPVASYFFGPKGIPYSSMQTRWWFFPVDRLSWKQLYESRKIRVDFIMRHLLHSFFRIMFETLHYKGKTVKWVNCPGRRFLRNEGMGMKFIPLTKEDSLVLTMWSIPASWMIGWLSATIHLTASFVNFGSKPKKSLRLKYRTQLRTVDMGVSIEKRTDGLLGSLKKASCSVSMAPQIHLFDALYLMDP